MGVSAREFETDRSLTTGLAARLACRRGALRATTAASRRAMCRQSRHPAAKACGGFLAVLPSQSETLPGDRGVGSRRPELPRAGARSRHPDRSAALPRLAERRVGRGADRRRACLARRSGELRDRLLVLVRGGADRGRHRGPPHRLRLQRPMYRTNIPCVPAGVFHGPLVVSMRPLRPADAIRAMQITSRFPSVHGAPVHLGMPEMIGIADIGKPDYGDAVRSEPTSSRCSGRAA